MRLRRYIGRTQRELKVTFRNMLSQYQNVLESEDPKIVAKIICNNSTISQTRKHRISDMPPKYLVYRGLPAGRAE
jgi:hypothetical protein